MPMASVSSCFKSSMGASCLNFCFFIDTPASKSQIAIELLKQSKQKIINQDRTNACICKEFLQLTL
ncbi:hypothetical protein FHY56_09425 [Brucella gallinifaecis]|uniref:Uncharacterized protein n=1 Tax=Brucella gallinifaecis TaxID=215590 RepID=A0A502BNM9_9HYPH|nr:hypothetical protein FHY56_09425 [Brucella gallinifaecis]